MIAQRVFVRATATASGLVVETGAGLPNADSYASIDTADAYLSNYGYVTWDAATDDMKSAALRRGTQYVDLTYGARWRGTRKNGRGQALDWPRFGATDCDGVPVPDDAVPLEIVNATIEAARRENANPNSLFPDSVPTKVQKRVQIGALEVEYFDPRVATGSTGTTPQIPVIDELVANLLLDCGQLSGGSGTGMNWLTRA